MTRYARSIRILMAGAACLALASCDGADGVASPGAGSVVVVTPPAPTPTPSPTGTPTPAAITAAQFAAQTTQSGVTVTSEEQLAIVNAGQNNNVNGTGAQINGVYPVGAASLTTPGNPATLGSFFQTTSFVGALSGPNDASFQGWTCNSSTAQFGAGSQSCAAVPAVGTGGATAVCPTGTTDVGVIATFRACRLPQVMTTSLSLPRIQGVVYQFNGQTEVGVPVGTTGADTGVTLTIAPGVTLVANASDSAPDVLLVNRGSRINAVGTATDPIIFTAQQNLTANGVSETSQGLWGGVILLGRAPIQTCASGSNNAGGTSTTCEANIEGVTGRLYGGPTQNDSSGVMQNVQIRYTGIAITDGNELQGLTLGGVGSGTTLDHIQSHNSADDGIEIFGGTANLRYLAITGADDDGIDIDNGYRGFIQFMITAQRLGGATADSFSTEIESNGNEDVLPRTFGRYANFTFIQTAATVGAIRLRGGADMAFINGIVRSPAGVAALNIIAGAGTGADRSTIRAANETLQDVGPPTFTSVYFAPQGR